MNSVSTLPTLSQTQDFAPAESPDRRGGMALQRVLVLEDEPGFREVIRDFLEESGCEVVVVQNGVEGVHEILAADFDVILCDMMMPAMPGDMFYRALERMRPHLCERFVFMTGHRGVPRINEFIANVHGTVLMKPFPVDDLLEMIAFVQVRRAVHAAA